MVPKRDTGSQGAKAVLSAATTVSTNTSSSSEEVVKPSLRRATETCGVGCLNGGHCGHANSCNCSLYQATGIRCQTVPNSGMEREMTCRTWGQYNYETFDGLYYYFPGSCTYTLVRDCEETTQSSIVIQVHNDPDCPRSPYSCARSVSLFLPWEGEIRLKKHDVTFRGQSLQLPHSVHDVELERISQYILVTQPHGFTLAWEGHSSSVYIKMSPEYVGRTCGLCGNFNADVQDDLKTSYGLFTEDLAVFGNSWMDVDPQRAACPLVPSRYPSPCSALDPNTLQKVMEVCASLLEDPFKSCHEFVSPFPYMASCSNDLCLLGSHNEAVCQVLTEYARACAHAERPLEGWRDHMPQCVVSCPPELIYQECISCCPVSCSVDRLCIDSRLQCLDGCYCGEDQIYKNGSCMKALDCPCEHHGMVYLPGQTIQEECNTCTCLGGLWNCSEHSCPGECSVTGDIHFETFDGRVYTFHATCQYVLAKSRNSGRFTVTIQNTPCGPNLDGACIQSVTVVMDEDPKAEVTMTHGGEVFVAGQYRISLPYLDEVFHIQELSSMFLQVRAAHGLLLQYNWGEFRLYLQVDESWKDDTVGLCGTFNGNSQDDFFSPSGMIESTPPLFGNSWKLSSACVQSPSVPQLDPCDTHQQAASYAAEMCELLNQAPFSACHALLSPLPFQQRCRADTCKCGRPCLCSALAGYARGCRKHGVTVDFRTHVPDCAITCPETMVYGTCVSSCERRCPSAAVAQHCGGECEEGCVCALGTFYSSRTRTCVDRSSCPCVFLGAEYAPGDVVLSSSGVHVCRDGKMVPQSSDIDKTCPPGQLYHDCADLDGRLPASKGVECEQTCETYLLNLTCSTHEPCVAGCVCPLGLLRHGDECFEPEACPCVWKGKEFFPGDKVTSPCHHCVCQHGTFQCEFRPCPSMCTAYGDRHYKTFDGLQFDYAGACKVYLLKSDVDASVSVTTENVDCFDSGVICRKSLVISIGKSVVAFDDDSGKPNPTSLIDSQQGLFIWQAGYFTILHVPNEDLTVMWDTKTTVHIQAGPRWQGKLVGLCGNYDLKTVNEMRTPENIESATPQEFGNSWTTAECVNSPDIRHPCSLSPLREPFAKRQCGILLSEVFQLCHPVVDVTWFYMNCLTDTCGCSRGGDCECFCTSVSAYAHRCCQLGVSVDWRSPAMCPYDCEFYNKVLGKGPYRLLTYREKDTLLAANSSGGVVFSLKGVSPATGVTTLFMMTPGLSRARPHDPSLVSFEAAERPNFFLRVGGDGLLRLTKWEDSERFWDESTYVLHRDTWISGYDSLESFAVRGHFLHSASPRLRLAKYSHSASFRRSILFRLMGTNSGTSMGPRCQWRYETCFSACFRTCSDPYGQTCTTIPKVEGCLPQCPGHMVLDEVTQRCVHLEDCIRPAVAIEAMTARSTVEAPAAVTSAAAVSTAAPSSGHSISPATPTSAPSSGHSISPATPTSARSEETTGPEEARVTTVVEVLTPSVIPSPPKVATTLHPEASTSSWTTKLPADEPELHGTSRATTVLSPVPKLTTAATMSTMLSTGKVTTAPVSHWLTSTRAVSDLTSRTTRSASTPPLLVLLSMASTTTSILPIAPASPSEMTTMKSTPTTTVPTTALHISTVTTTSAVSIPPTKVYRETSMPDSTETAKLTTRSTTEATPLPATGTAIKTSLTTAPSRPVHTEAGASSIHTTESTTPVTLQTTHPSTLETRRPLIWEITSEKLVATSPVDLRTSTTPVLPSVSTSTVRTTLFPATASTSESPIPTKKTTVISTSAISSTATGASTLPIPETSTETTTVHPVTSTVSTLKTSPSVSLDIATTVKSTATSPVTTVTSDSGLTTTNVSTLMTQTTTTQAIVLDVSHTSVKSPETPAVTSEAPHVISTASVSTPTTTGVITPGSETSTLPVTLSPTEATTKAVSSMAAKHPSAPTTSTEYVPFKTSLTPVQWTDRVTTSEVPAKPFTSYSTSTTEVPRDVFTTTAAKPIMVTVTEVTVSTSPVSHRTTAVSDTPFAVASTEKTTILPESDTTTHLTSSTETAAPETPAVSLLTTVIPTQTTAYSSTTRPLSAVPTLTETTSISSTMTKTEKVTTMLTTSPSSTHPAFTTSSTATSEKMTTVHLPVWTTEETTITTSTLGPTVSRTTGAPTSIAVSSTEASIRMTTTESVSETTPSEKPPALRTTTTAPGYPSSPQATLLATLKVTTHAPTSTSTPAITSESLDKTTLHTTVRETTSTPALSLATITVPPLAVTGTTGVTSKSPPITLERTTERTTRTLSPASLVTAVKTESTRPSLPDRRTTTMSTTMASPSTHVETVEMLTTVSSELSSTTLSPHTVATTIPMSMRTTKVPGSTTVPSAKMCTPPYSEIIDECTKYVCVGGQLILFNKSQNCPFKATPPNCGLLGFAILVNGDKCCPLWDCPCRCSVFPDLNVITFDGNSVGVYKAASYVVSQLPNETVSIQVRECRSTDSVPSKLLWNFTNLCLVALNITHNSHQVLVNRLQRRLYVNSRYAKPRFKKNGFEVLDTGNMYLIRTPAGLKMQWFHSTGMMVIETDGYNNKLPTMGLCGCCDGSPANDLTLSNGTALGKGEDPAVFIDSWQLPNTTSYISHSRRREVNCSTSDCSRCLDMLRNSTFRPCHAFVPPSVFCEVWVRDEEYVKNPCVSLAAYVASCHKFNICVKWRSPDFCPFACPPGLRYQGCLPACTAQSCPNQEFDSEPEECSGLTEGCVCPEGTVLHRPYSALCIPSEKCACTDSSGNPRALGEVWTTSRDGCCMYKCDNDSIVPVEYDCTDVPQPVCRRMGEVAVSLADDKSCCPRKACVCNQTLCESYPPQCKYGEKLVSYFREDSCCPDYICECDPSRCESDVPTCREDQTLIATRADGSCCLAYICMCGPCADVIPQCQEGEVLTVDTNSTERCCPAYHCVCEPYRCPKVSCLPGMSEVTVASPERCCPLQTCECACDTIPRPKCHLGETLQVDRVFLTDPGNKCGCRRYKCEREAVCLDGERGVMRPGQTLVEHSPEGVCYTTQCTHALDTATGFFRTRATSRNCSSQCQPNQVYIPPKDQMTCCGFCKNISCMYTNENGSVELYKPGRTWVSDCLKYECTDTLSGPTLVSYPFSCPPFNESECIKIGGTILSYMGGCCRTCKEDGKSCQKVTVRMTIRKNDCRSNRPVNIVSCDGKCPSASIYNYNINTYARFCKCCREVGLQKRSVQLFCSGNSTWVTYTIQEPTDCSCQWS
ncbi:otogelin [Paramormyrops kingsleyae]|uniref:otogelin n=1 Tax=Paramormyrops kingsleyae TaxID=1676925 RepID=UPI003B97A2C4